MKFLYIVPVFGWIACAVSIVMLYIREDGRTLHDLVGNTRVVYCFVVPKAEEGEDESK